MQQWVCVPCGYVYDPEVGDLDSGIEPGTPFESLPDDWVCPVCGVDKTLFEPYNEQKESRPPIALYRKTPEVRSVFLFYIFIEQTQSWLR